MTTDQSRPPLGDTIPAVLPSASDREKSESATPRRPAASWSSFLSVPAIIISMATFYLTNCHIKNTLEVAVAHEGLVNGPGDEIGVEADVVLRNHGNRTQTLLGAELQVRSKRGAVILGRRPPLVLKASEAATIPFRESSTYEVLSGESDWDDAKEEGKSQAVLVLSAVLPDGTACETAIPLLAILFREATDQAERLDKPRAIKWTELLRPAPCTLPKP